MAVEVLAKRQDYRDGRWQPTCDSVTVGPVKNRSALLRRRELGFSIKVTDGAKMEAIAALGTNLKIAEVRLEVDTPGHMGYLPDPKKENSRWKFDVKVSSP